MPNWGQGWGCFAWLATWTPGPLNEDIGALGVWLTRGVAASQSLEIGMVGVCARRVAAAIGVGRVAVAVGARPVAVVVGAVGVAVVVATALRLWAPLRAILLPPLGDWWGLLPNAEPDQ
eukprot:1587347-Pyramimonas_sp.AAC.1